MNSTLVSEPRDIKKAMCLPLLTRNIIAIYNVQYKMPIMTIAMLIPIYHHMTIDQLNDQSINCFMMISLPSSVQMQLYIGTVFIPMIEERS